MNEELTPGQAARRHARLAREVESAEGVYSRAKGRRQDTGSRIQSRAETSAAARLSDARSALRQHTNRYGTPQS